jgi:ABC-type multidrug transport system ATPase subunit
MMAPSETTMAIPVSPPVGNPVMTVWSGSSQRTFARGRDIVVGRDPRADICIASPLVSRAHILLRFGAGQWAATDNGSLNGIFVNGRRVPSVAISDGQIINIGEPDGPALTFGFGRHTGGAEAPPTAPVVLRTSPSIPQAATPRNSAPKAQSRRRASVPGAITVGRTPDNDVVIADVLASRHHAMLVPTGGAMEIRDAGTLNGTFVNGVRIDAAPLHEGDVVTIGNVDVVFSAGTLVPRCQIDTASPTGGLQVQGATLTIEQGRTLLDNIAFSARPGTLTAVIGPSGAGKSTLAKLIAGTTLPTQGRVSFEGHDIHAAYASLRSRIGLVPQDDVVHSRLTVDQALNYAAELRLPPDTSKEDRRQIVAQVLEELELTPHANTRVDKLSGGQRKRASVAMELLTGPSLLILDEPTSGLDPALDRQVMAMLRKLADAGRVVIVVTHSLTYLNVCDQVVLLAPGGKVAFSGSPADVGPAMGTTDWADIFSEVAANPDAANQRYLARVGPSPAPAEAEKPADLGKPVQTSLRRQFATIARRQLRLILSDRGYFIFLVLLPFILGALSLAVPGNVGFGIPNPMGSAPDEPSEILVLLNIGAVFMGIALTIRDLIGERPIFRREQAVGLSTWAYLMAKVVVYCTAAVIGSAVMVGIVLFGKNGPTRGAVLLHNAALELFVTVAATCVASVILGLALSALARSNEQIMPLLVVAIMSQLVLSGGLLPVAARLGLEQLSWVTPARWGHAAAASTVDLRVLEPDPGPQDVHWGHMPGAWLFDMAMLAVLCLVYGSFVRWKLRLKAS